MYKAIIAQEAEPNSSVNLSAMHLHMMRSEDANEQDQRSRSPSQASYLTTLSARNATPELLLLSTLSHIQSRIESQIQEIAQTFRASHTEDAFLPMSSSVTHTHQDNQRNLRLPKSNQPLAAFPTGKVPVSAYQPQATPTDLPHLVAAKHWHPEDTTSPLTHLPMSAKMRASIC
jgi:hypothetical protein